MTRNPKLAPDVAMDLREMRTDTRAVLHSLGLGLDIVLDRDHAERITPEDIARARDWWQRAAPPPR